METRWLRSAGRDARVTLLLSVIIEIVRMRTLSVATVAATALPLSACADARVAPAGRANDVDTSHAQSMRIRDLQDVSFAQLSRVRGANDAVQQLADMFITERQPAADAATKWLATWGRSVAGLMTWGRKPSLS